MRTDFQRSLHGIPEQQRDEGWNFGMPRRKMVVKPEITGECHFCGAKIARKYTVRGKERIRPGISVAEGVDRWYIYCSACERTYTHFSDGSVKEGFYGNGPSNADEATLTESWERA